MSHEENNPAPFTPYLPILLLPWGQCIYLFGTGTEVSLTALRCEPQHRTLRLLLTLYIHRNDFPNKAGYLPESNSGADCWVNEVIYA